MSGKSKTVLILGAGINGCAIARELVLNGVNVWLVDQADVATGATSGSSRLIHGGLRYLEYAEFDLVKESLAERTRLLRLAPQFVRPLKLWIPAANRFGGAIPAVGKFFGWKWWPQPQVSRGSALVRAGLIFYDAYAQDETLPKHHCGRAPVAGAPAFDPQTYPRLCSYYDGQVPYPERLLISMLADTQQLAAEQGTDFHLLTYHRAQLHGTTVEISPAEGLLAGSVAATNATFEPDLIVNATGAWVDETLQRLDIPAQRLMGGTKGSHLFSFSPKLKQQLNGDQGIYAEARDGRPIFITPLADTVLIGTTDVKFDGPPETARATEEEIQYLIDSVNHILPNAQLTESDIAFHYSAVRPLPYVDARTTAAITRRHQFVEHAHGKLPVMSIVGGKLTTMRSLAEQAVVDILKHFERVPAVNSENRPFPGSEGYPASPSGVEATQRAIAERTQFPLPSVIAVWMLHGTKCESLLAAASNRDLLPDCELPEAVVRHAIAAENAVTLGDLVERRTMLLYHPRLTRACLRRMAELLAEASRLPAQEIDAATTAECARLAARFGKTVT
jgi:glycerol-3-phosphate dehydrogenase